MARPKKYTADYFPFLVKDGRTLVALQARHGLEGIGFFTNLMRLLTATPEHHLCLASEADKVYVLARIGCSEERSLEIIETLVMTHKIHRDLWETASVIYCPDLVESLSVLYARRKMDPVTSENLIQRYISDQEIPEQRPIDPPQQTRPQASPSIRKRVFDREGPNCRYCGTELTFETFQVDHIIPTVSGGTNVDDNLGVACASCNNAKGVMTETQFREVIADINSTTPSNGDHAVDINPQSRVEESRGEKTLTTSSPPKAMAKLKDELAARWEKAFTDQVPMSAWGDIGRGRRDCVTLAKKLRALSKDTWIEEVELASSLITAFMVLKRRGKSDFWRTATFTPTGFVARWAEIVDEAAKENEKPEMDDSTREFLEGVNGKRG